MTDITIENPKSLAFRVFLRFGRAFLAGGLAALFTVSALPGYTLADLRVWVLTLIIAFVTGGLQGLDKFVRE